MKLHGVFLTLLIAAMLIAPVTIPASAVSATLSNAALTVVIGNGLPQQIWTARVPIPSISTPTYMYLFDGSVWHVLGAPVSYVQTSSTTYTAQFTQSGYNITVRGELKTWPAIVLTWTVTNTLEGSGTIGFLFTVDYNVPGSRVQPWNVNEPTFVGFSTVPLSWTTSIPSRYNGSNVVVDAEAQNSWCFQSVSKGIGLTAVVASSYPGLHTNPLTLALALLTAFTYVAIYTPLKRVTAIATFIGAFPGAMGPLLGWTAARGRIEWQGVALFAILFVWQFPHFMAISWLYRDDYARAGIRMLPVVQPDGWSTVAEALFFAVAMIPVSLVPWRLGMAGAVYAWLAAALGLLYLAYTIRFAGILRTSDETESRMLARDLLKVSVLYLPLLFTTLMVCAIAK